MERLSIECQRSGHCLRNPHCREALSEGEKKNYPVVLRFDRTYYFCDIVEWGEDNPHVDFLVTGLSTPLVVQFKTTDDAMAFKLRWG